MSEKKQLSKSLYDKLQVWPENRQMAPEDRLKAMEWPLLYWYGKHARTLPWRENKDPYRVWISEIMLQQTRVEAVKPYFDRFIKALPGISHLAEVPEDRLLKLWEGLGYYSRAKNLKKAAQLLVENFDGELPRSWEKLQKLPGIGSYTAGAIASIAFDLPVPAVDGNVLRVISRVTKSFQDITKQSVKRDIEEMLLALMPKTDPGSYNQALIEIGAIVCTPKAVLLCGECPLASVCGARLENLTEVLPVKTPKKARRIEKRTVLLLWQNGKVAIRKRKDTGLLASMYELPSKDGHLEEADLLRELGVEDVSLTPLPAAKHIFSHVEWHMTGYSIYLKEPLSGDCLWVTPEEVRNTYSLPGAFKMYTKLIR